MRYYLSGDLSGGVLMLMLRQLSPVDYRLCNQTVTVYHWDEKETYTTTVIEDAFLEHRTGKRIDKTGQHEEDSFLLVIPGAEVRVAVKDKVLLGRGEEISTREAWAALHPSKVPDLVVVKWVEPKYWRGQIVHTEAGG